MGSTSDFDWMSLEREIVRVDTSHDLSDLGLVRGFASILQPVLITGQRLVIFCEIEGKPPLKTLGLDKRSVSALLEILEKVNLRCA